MALKDVIKESRLKVNLKQEDAAAKVGVTVQTYSKWENGKTEPKASQVSQLAKILNLSEREICRGELNKKYSLEEFLELSSAVSKGKHDSTNEALMLWRMLDDHQAYIDAKQKIYKDEKYPKAVQDAIDAEEKRLSIK